MWTRFWVNNIELWLDLGYIVLKFALRTNLELGPRFAKICSEKLLYHHPLQRLHASYICIKKSLVDLNFLKWRLCYSSVLRFYIIIFLEWQPCHSSVMVIFINAANFFIFTQRSARPLMHLFQQTIQLLSHSKIFITH